jgi:hypothetical protein
MVKSNPSKDELKIVVEELNELKFVMFIVLAYAFLCPTGIYYLRDKAEFDVSQID